MILPCADGNVDLTDDLIDGIKLRHPHVSDMHSELLKINLWLHRYPTRRPKCRTFFVFLDKWMRKVQPKPVKMHLVGGKMSEAEMLEAGAKMGIAPRPGETWEAFARRLRGAA